MGFRSWSLVFLVMIWGNANAFFELFAEVFHEEFFHGPRL